MKVVRRVGVLSSQQARDAAAHRKLVRGYVRSLSLALLLAATLPCALNGAFSMRIGGSARRQLELVGGQPVYSARASYNGTAATIDLLGFSLPAADVINEVRRIHRIPRGSDSNAIWLSWQQRRRPRHLLVLPGNTSASATAWLIAPEKAIPTGSARLLPEPPGFNPAPAATLEGWIAIESSRTLLTWHETRQSPAAALDGVAATLASHGWHIMLRSDLQLLLVNDSRAGVVNAITDPLAQTTHLGILLQGGAR